MLIVSVLHKNRFVFTCVLQMIATGSYEEVHGGRPWTWGPLVPYINPDWSMSEELAH